MATSDEQFREPPPYPSDMTSLSAADALRLPRPDSGPGPTGRCLDELEIAGIAEGTAGQVHSNPQVLEAYLGRKATHA